MTELQKRDQEILKHINEYCSDVNEIINRFGRDIQLFQSDKAYRHASTMCILQIGELSKHLSSEFCDANKEIPWGSIKAMRNVFAHNYGNVSIEDTWDTLQFDIPILQKFCQNQLQNISIV